MLNPTVIFIALTLILLQAIKVGRQIIAARRQAEDAPTKPTPPPQSKPIRTSVYFVIGVFGMIFAVLATYTLVEWRREYDNSENWPSTSGTITRAEITSDYTNDNPNGDHYSYQVHLTYEYLVTDQMYSNNDRHFSVATLLDHGLLEGLDIVGHGAFFWRSDAKSSLGGYHTGQTVTVFYNPDNPGQSVLEHHFDNRAYYIFTTITIMLALVGRGGFIGVLQNRRNKIAAAIPVEAHSMA